MSRIRSCGSPKAITLITADRAPDKNEIVVAGLSKIIFYPGTVPGRPPGGGGSAGVVEITVHAVPFPRERMALVYAGRDVTIVSLIGKISLIAVMRPVAGIACALVPVADRAPYERSGRVISGRHPGRSAGHRRIHPVGYQSGMREFRVGRQLDTDI